MKTSQHTKPSEDIELIASMDIGSQKIAIVLAALKANGTFDILGVSNTPSHGMRHGMVADINAVVSALHGGIVDVEEMSGKKIEKVYLGIGGEHIHGVSSNGLATINNQEISPLQVQEVKESASHIQLLADQEILDVIPQNYIIDNQKNIINPIGMSGMRLEAQVYIIKGSITARENLIRCVRRCGVDVVGVLPQPLATYQCCLRKDEQDMGVVVLDIGSGTTNIVIHADRAIQHIQTLTIAGDDVTNDIAVALYTTSIIAEDLKKRYGVAMESMADRQGIIEVPFIKEERSYQLPHHILGRTIEERVKEIYKKIKEVIDSSEYKSHINRGIITGGMANLPGMVDIGENILQIPLRIGVPEYQGDLADIINTPFYSAAMGLLYQRQEQALDERRATSKDRFSKSLKSIRKWFLDSF